MLLIADDIGHILSKEKGSTPSHKLAEKVCQLISQKCGMKKVEGHIFESIGRLVSLRRNYEFNHIQITPEERVYDAIFASALLALAGG